MILRALGEDLFRAPLPASGGLLAIFDAPCLGEASPHTWSSSSLAVCVQISPLYKDTTHWIRGPLYSYSV